MFGSFEREESSRVKERRVVERRIEGNGYLSPYLDVFKFK